MARDRRFDLEDLASRPGTYFSPQTEVLVIVDDSSSIDSEIFNMEEFEGADWVLISDDVPVDESQRDEILENFQATFHGGDGRMDELEEDEDEDRDDDKDDDEEADGYGDEEEEGSGDGDDYGHLALRPQYFLAVFIPAAIALDAANASDTVVFFTAALALVPAAAAMGRATEEAAGRAGPGIGGLLNVTFGNAPELIIALFALNKGLHEVTKASIAGSIISNVLLVLGAAMFAGGLRAPRAEGRDYREQRFTLGMAHPQSAMLIFAVFALTLPMVNELVKGHGVPPVGTKNHDFPAPSDHLSLAIAIVLIAVYCAGLLFSLGTHRHLFNPFHEDEGPDEDSWTMQRAVT